MSALTGARNTSYPGVDKAILNFLELPLTANATVYNGGIVVVSAGYAKPGATALGLLAAGFLDSPNAYPSYTAGSTDGSVTNRGSSLVRVRQGVGRMGNSTSTDAIAQADIGKVCYLVDDQTVAKTNGSGTRSVAGIVMGVSTQGVDVFVCLQTNAALASLVTQLGAGNADEVAASAALSLTARTSRLTISGTKAYTLADGSVAGQRKTVFVVSAGSTPSGVLTPAHASGFTTITFGAGTANSSVELEWDASLGTPAWKIVGVTTTASGTLTIA